MLVAFIITSQYFQPTIPVLRKTYILYLEHDDNNAHLKLFSEVRFIINYKSLCLMEISKYSHSLLVGVQFIHWVPLFVLSFFEMFILFIFRCINGLFYLSINQIHQHRIFQYSFSDNSLIFLDSFLLRSLPKAISDWVVICKNM